ncbi:hypothetical protein BJY04DRAFT_222593 [Aspergillus karnatakaensis]|uniref:Dabb family protein n=1 Tax=Aspergillus karnatakaensis TaxID=1810916 RepID=UPI003CCD962F
MTVTHMIVCRFKDGTSNEVIEEVCRDIVALKDTCINPVTQKPYIKSFVGGKDHSPEGAQHGMTHGFVAQFESPEDRNYYVSQDSAHLALGVKIAPVVEKFLCLDFTEGFWCR